MKLLEFDEILPSVPIGPKVIAGCKCYLYLLRVLPGEAFNFKEIKKAKDMDGDEQQSYT